MKPEDFTKERFLLKLPLYIGREETFRLIATAAGLEKWFLGRVGFRDTSGTLLPDGSELPPGGTYAWTWQKGYSIEGRVLDFEPQEKFAFTFGGPFQVEFDLTDLLDGEDDVTGTVLHLTQINNTPSADNEFGFINCCVCWTFFLTNLKSVAEQGMDLRESRIIDESFINQ